MAAKNSEYGSSSAIAINCAAGRGHDQRDQRDEDAGHDTAVEEHAEAVHRERLPVGERGAQARASAAPALASWNTTSAGAHHVAITTGSDSNAVNSMPNCSWGSERRGELLLGPTSCAGPP